jgi:hypothetical protein
MLIFHQYGEPLLAKHIVIIFDTFGGLADVIKYAIFHNDRSMGFRSAGA